MKILFVSIPNHHFFQWANQLKDAGHEVHWFDITDGAGFSSKINWIQQHNGWKLRWNFPGRYFLKRKFPSIYQFINRFNTHKTTTVFNNLVTTLQPDIIHCFEMNLSGIPIVSVLEQHASIPLIYSSWGSDLYDFILYLVSASGAVSRPTQQSAKAVRGPHQQQRVPTTKAVHIT